MCVNYRPPLPEQLDMVLGTLVAIALVRQRFRGDRGHATLAVPAVASIRRRRLPDVAMR